MINRHQNTTTNAMKFFLGMLPLLMGLASFAGAQEFVEMTHVGKRYFSNTPFTNSHAGAKGSSTSAKGIYGRLEFNDGKKLFEIFEGGDKFGANDNVYLYYNTSTSLSLYFSRPARDAGH